MPVSVADAAHLPAMGLTKDETFACGERYGHGLMATVHERNAIGHESSRSRGEPDCHRLTLSRLKVGRVDMRAVARRPKRPAAEAMRKL